MRWQLTLALMALVYALNQLLGGLYATTPEIDIPMHIIGGFLAATLALGLWQSAARRCATKNVPPVAIAIGLISFAALVAVLWEFHEYLIDWFHRGAGNWNGQPMQPSLADTIKDLADGLIGACLAVLAFRKQLSEPASVVKRK